MMKACLVLPQPTAQPEVGQKNFLPPFQGEVPRISLVQPLQAKVGKC